MAKRQFNQISFQNEPSEETPLSASNLNAIQTRINQLFTDTPNGTTYLVTNANAVQDEGTYIISSTGTTNFPFTTTATSQKRGMLIVMNRYYSSSPDTYKDTMQIAIAPLTKSIWIRTGVKGTNSLTSLTNWTRLYEPPTILYEDLTTQNGTPNDVTLSDSAENYDFIEIYYARRSASDSGSADSGEIGAPKQCVKVDNPNGKYVSFGLNYATGNDTVGVQIYADKVYVNGTKIQRIASCWFGIAVNNTVSQYNANNQGGTMYIYRVIGYKKIGGEVS